MSRPLELVLPGGLTMPLTAELVADLEVAVRAWRRRDAERRDITAEIEVFLAAHPGASTIEIARGIRVRDNRIRDTLTTDPRFRRAAPVPDSPGRARKWILAQDACEPVPTMGTGTRATGGEAS
jgi:hypothetical protein